MQLCLECGRIEEHRDECPRRPPIPGTPVEKQKRVQKAMAVAQAVLDATGLGELPVKKMSNLDRPVKKILEEIGERLDASRALDAKVTEWTWKNLGRLMLGLDPLEIPTGLLRKSTGVFGKLGVSSAKVAEI